MTTTATALGPVVDVLVAVPVRDHHHNTRVG
jgi:hypothetical protein